MLLNANLRKANYNVVIYEIKIKKKFKKFKKKKAKTLIKINKKIYLKIIIEKTK